MSDPDEPVEIPIEDVLDLHPFRPREVREVARDYLEAARQRGFREVRLIHGKGIGVQRTILRSLLESLEFVESWRDADAGGGGWGATIVVLRPD
ncbi:MAG TPA: Smr/MutS family protein [Thermoanaerobaculia bacterium]|nr:Smr/MutS family protein [Thermoanaerobaculia bacterium]